MQILVLLHIAYNIPLSTHIVRPFSTRLFAFKPASSLWRGMHVYLSKNFVGKSYLRVPSVKRGTNYKRSGGNIVEDWHASDSTTCLPSLRTMVYKLFFQVHDIYWVVSTVPRMVNYRSLGCSCVYCRTGQGVPHETIRLCTSIQEQGWIPSPPRDFLTGTHDTKDEFRHPLAVGSNLHIALALSASEQECAEMQRISKKARDAARTSFSSPLELRKLFAWPQIALTHVGLNFSTFEYLEFFELRLHQPTFQYVQEMQRLVRTIPTLTKLDIKFRDPRWEIWGGYPHFLLRKAALICHRKVVSLILILAIPNLCHIEEVRIEGHATQIQCDLFYRALHKYKTSAHDRA
jgi:hypothetical protein